MYYITRTFKVPENDVTPILSMGYFGKFHSENIMYFLTEIMKTHSIKYNIKNDKDDLDFRCITFPKFNLNDILDKYKNEEKVNKSSKLLVNISKTLPMKSTKKKYKQKWFEHGKGLIMQEDFNPASKGKMDRVILIDIDRGLAWNPMGKQHSKPVKGTGWVWAHPDESMIIEYINNLYDEEWEEEIKTKKKGIAIITKEKRKGSIPVLFSESQSKDTQKAVVEMCEDLKYQPLIVLGFTVDDVLEIALENYNDDSTVMYLSDNYFVISIPTLSEHIEGIDLEDLEITPQYNEPDPAPYKVGILIGQQGSGKSTYCEYLESIGYIIIGEKEAGKIRNKSTKKAIKEFEDQIDEVLKCKKNKKKDYSCEDKKGIIIDATNPSEDSRATYNEIAEEKGIEVVNLWLSKSGFNYNSKREHPVSKIALNMYTSKLELPEEYIRVL